MIEDNTRGRDDTAPKTQRLTAIRSGGIQHNTVFSRLLPWPHPRSAYPTTAGGAWDGASATSRTCRARTAASPDASKDRRFLGRVGAGAETCPSARLPGRTGHPEPPPRGLAGANAQVGCGGRRPSAAHPGSVRQGGSGPPVAVVNGTPEAACRFQGGQGGHCQLTVSSFCV